MFVRLLDEGVDVWRPVPAEPLGGNVFRLSREPAPEDEAWEFRPGTQVTVRERVGAEGPFLAAHAVAGLVSLRG